MSAKIEKWAADMARQATDAAGDEFGRDGRGHASALRQMVVELEVRARTVELGIEIAASRRQPPLDPDVLTSAQLRRFLEYAAGGGYGGSSAVFDRLREMGLVTLGPKWGLTTQLLPRGKKLLALLRERGDA